MYLGSRRYEDKKIQDSLLDLNGTVCFFDRNKPLFIPRMVNILLLQLFIIINNVQCLIHCV